MRIVFIGCVAFSAALLERLLRHPEAEVAGVVTRRESLINADFASLEPLARGAGVPCREVEGNEQDSLIPWVTELHPDVIFCFGWSSLLRTPLLRIPPLGVIGYHPALLPANRGRHPIIWALTLGLSETGSTFFRLTEQADSGEIFSQVRVPISPDDDAAILYRRLQVVALDQLDALVSGLAHNTLVPHPQNDALANVWRKRSPADGRIDWRVTTRGIHNLVRAITRPYPGATCRFQGEEIRIWRVAPGPPAPENLEPGKVLAHLPEGILVKSGDGSVLLTAHEFPNLPKPGEYLF